jgi:hypothetical protein
MRSLRGWSDHTRTFRIVQINGPREWPRYTKWRSVDANGRKRPKRCGIGGSRRCRNTRVVCACGIRAIRVWNIWSGDGRCGKSRSRIYARADCEVDGTDRLQWRRLYCTTIVNRDGTSSHAIRPDVDRLTFRVSISSDTSTTNARTITLLAAIYR